MRLIYILLVCLLIRPGLAAATQAWARVPASHDPITGLWITQDKDAAVEMYECDGQICGRFYWLREESTDVHNHDPKKHATPLCRMQFIGGFRREEDNSYNDGWIYNPEDGATYEAEMNLIDRDTLHLHGYVVVPLFGQSQTWKRTSSSTRCKTGQG